MEGAEIHKTGTKYDITHLWCLWNIIQRLILQISLTWKTEQEAMLPFYAAFEYVIIRLDLLSAFEISPASGQARLIEYEETRLDWT